MNPNLTAMSEENKQGEVISTIEEGIGTVTFYHPKGNSLPGRLLNELAGTIHKVSREQDVRLICLQSRGDGAFCAGASFTELLRIEDYVQGKEFFMGFARVINALRKAPQLVLARVHGKTVGGGVGLAAAADYTLAAAGASIKLSELALGIGPFVVGPAIKRKVGTSAFTDLTINAREWKDARWARENGLYARVYDTIDELDQAVGEYSRELADNNPEASKELKAMFWDDAKDWDELLEERAEISAHLVLTPHAQQALRETKAKIEG